MQGRKKPLDRLPDVAFHHRPLARLTNGELLQHPSHLTLTVECLCSLDTSRVERLHMSSAIRVEVDNKNIRHLVTFHMSMFPQGSAKRGHVGRTIVHQSLGLRAPFYIGLRLVYAGLN